MGTAGSFGSGAAAAVVFFFDDNLVGAPFTGGRLAVDFVLLLELAFAMKVLLTKNLQSEDQREDQRQRAGAPAVIAEAAEAAAKKLNEEFAPVETKFTVEFRDSSDTEYLFEITVFVKATYKAVVDAYGHWTVEFDKYAIGSDITKAEIKGQSYAFDSTQPEYKDRYVAKDNRADAASPVYDTKTLTYTY